MHRVLLINMPFAAVESPSLALGLFKSNLQKQGISCHVEYLNIDFARTIGMENYNFIVMGPSIMAGERLFSHILFGNQIPDDSQYYAFISNNISLDAPNRLNHIKSMVDPFLQNCLRQIPWDQYDIIGFTSLFEQNLPSLALAFLIKQRFPQKIIVFGGANWEGIMGLTLHRCFPFVDYVCSGEADFTFPELVKRLYYKHPITDLSGIVYRENGKSIYTGKAPLVHDLDLLPMPVYDDYFNALKHAAMDTWFNPTVLFETSRGCWWGQKNQCRFCGLNGEHLTFRSKSTHRIIQEIIYLHQQYNATSLRAVDNVLNLHYFQDLLPELGRLKLKLSIIFEIRSNLDKKQVKMLKDSNIPIVQAGIENLSTPILKLMNKGTNSLLNIQLLKWTKQYQVHCDWNMIFGFPGEKPDDYRKCMDLAKCITHLNPPTGYSTIRMDRFSPNFNHAQELGFIHLRPAIAYRYIYPFDEDTLFDMVPYFDFDYKEKIDDDGIFSSLQELVLQWKTKQDKLVAYKNNDGIIIEDTRAVASSPSLIVTGIHQLIYEFCDRIRSFNQIKAWLAENNNNNKANNKTCLTPNEIKEILDDFIARKIMIQEDDRYLSLAIMAYPLEHTAAHGVGSLFVVP